MRSINYADSATQTLPFTLVVSYVTPLSFSFLLSSVLHLPLPPGIVFPLNHPPAFASSPVFSLRPISLPPLVGPASPSTAAMLARDANNAHFAILHSRCNERSYCGYNAVTSACCTTATVVDQISGSLFTTAGTVLLYQCNCVAYGRFSVFSRIISKCDGRDAITRYHIPL